MAVRVLKWIDPVEFAWKQTHPSIAFPQYLADVWDARTPFKKGKCVRS